MNFAPPRQQDFTVIQMKKARLVMFWQKAYGLLQRSWEKTLKDMPCMRKDLRYQDMIHEAALVWVLLMQHQIVADVIREHGR